MGSTTAKSPAIEIADVLETSAGRRLLGRHLAKQSAHQVVTAAVALGTFFEQLGDDIAREQADVLGDHGDEKLENETLCADAVFAARDDAAEKLRHAVGGFARDFDAGRAEMRGS